MHVLQLAGQRLVLLPQRGVYLADEGILLVADAHIGKAVSFRRLGVPVPQGTTSETLERLDAALAACGAAQVVFLGDLLHSSRAAATATFAAVQQWRDRHPALQLTLVRGNHDRRAGDPPAQWAVHSVDEPLSIGPFALVHHPQPVAGRYALAGHVHPCVVLGGRAHDRLRLPCFHFGPALGLLPAFGAFTGMHAVARNPSDRVFVVHGDAVRPVPA